MGMALINTETEVLKLVKDSVAKLHYNKQVFIRRLKYLRNEHNITQPQLAQIMNVSKGAIGHWEAGTREPSIDTVYRLAHLFDVSVDYMMGLSDFRREDEAIDYMLEKLKEAGLVTADDTVDKRTVDKLVGFIAAVSKLNS